MEVLGQLVQEGDKILILSARFSGLFFAPVYNSRNIPTLWKASFIAFLSFLGWQLGLSNSLPSTKLLPFFLLYLSEFLLGVALALITQFFFAAIQLAAQMIDTQMGFGIVNVFDPLSGAPSPILGNFKYILALLVFMQIDGHHLFLQALLDSFTLIPLGEVSFKPEFYSLLSSFFGNIFLTALKLSLPLVSTLLVTDFVMGIISSTIPQMNIFMVGMPAKILLGFIVLIVILPLYVYLLNPLFEHMFKEIYQLMSVLA